MRLQTLLNRFEILFTINRYFTYALRVAWGFIVAKQLGPYFFGIWGFIQLLIQYLSYTNLGSQFAINTELSIRLSWTEEERAKYIGHALSMSTMVAVVLISIGIILTTLHIEIFEKYKIGKYALLIAIYT